MKLYRSTTIRALSTLLIGALVIAFPSNATKYLVIIIGALFFVPGLISLVAYILHKRKQKKISEETALEKPVETKKSKGSELFPIIGVGSILFGAILMLFPLKFQNALLYILGAFLILAALSQAFNMYKLSKTYKVHFITYLIAALVGIAGIVIIMLNYKAASTLTDEVERTAATYAPSMIFGIASVLFGISELIYAIYFRSPELKSSSTDLPAKNTDKNADIEEAEIVE